MAGIAKNIIIVIGDGMGWEMTRANAIANEIKSAIDLIKADPATAHLTNQQIYDRFFAQARLGDYYTAGQGVGNSYQQLSGFTLATTSNTYIDGDKSNSALQGHPTSHGTGATPLRDGFRFLAQGAVTEGLASGGIFNENPVVNGQGKIQGGHIPLFNPTLGGKTPWDSNYYSDRDQPSPGFDREYIKNLYPDSAGTATGLQTGTKTYVGAIGVDIFEEQVSTLAEQALALGKSAGVVSSVPFNHATPAAAVAHVNHRQKYNEGQVDQFGDEIGIPDNIFEQIVNVTKPTVVLGGGHPLTQGGTLTSPNQTYVTASGMAKLRGGEYDYTFIERGPNIAQTLAATASNLDPDRGDRLFGIFGARGQGGNLPWRTANDDYSATGGDTNTAAAAAYYGQTEQEFIAQELNENPTLNQLTTAALEVLGKDDQGFWLMVEGGDIDWAAHGNDLDALLGTLRDLDEAVATVQNWISHHGGYEENLLIVTADHDHYLTLNDNFPAILAQDLLLGNGGLSLTREVNPDLAGHFWGSDPTIKNGWGTHTTRPVPVYYQGAGGEYFASLVGRGYTAYGEKVPGIEGFIDQVNIGQVMQGALLGPEAVKDLQAPPIMDMSALSGWVVAIAVLLVGSWYFFTNKKSQKN